MKKFPTFWFESREWWGLINSETKLHGLIDYFEKHNVSKTELLLSARNAFIDRRQEFDNFGLRKEHKRGVITLAQYLKGHGIVI